MSEDIAIKVEKVSKTFKLPHEKNSSVKGALIGLVHGGKRTFEKQEVLKDISFEIKQGDFFAIVGRNGSGKSTLLKMLAGIYAPTEGQIHVRGKLTPFIELGVGFNHELTGRENVFLNGALLGFNRAEMLAMYDDIVAFAELEKFMDQKLKNYSSGMQVRLAFSIAIRARTDILLLDEVLAVGDAAFQQKCFDYFEELKREKKTVVFVSHDMGAVTRFCTRSIYLKDGNMIADGSPTDIADLYRQENIKVSEEANDDGPQSVKGFNITAKISNQTKTEATYTIQYKAEPEVPTYVGISILKDGMSFAEISTSLSKPLHAAGKLTYTIDTTVLNGGTYEATAALFRLENRELLAFTRRGSKFVVDGTDITKGAALKLADTWKYND